MSADQSVCLDAVQRMRISVIRYGAAFAGQGEGLRIDRQASVFHHDINLLVVSARDVEVIRLEVHRVCPCIRSGCFRCLSGLQFHADILRAVNLESFHTLLFSGIGLLFLAAPDRNRRFLLLADRQRTRCFRDLVVRRDIRIPGLDLRFTCEFSFIGSGIGSGCSVRDSLEFMSADQSVCRDAVQRMRFSVIRYGVAFTGQGEGLPIDRQASVFHHDINFLVVSARDVEIIRLEIHRVCPCIRSGCFRCLSGLQFHADILRAVNLESFHTLLFSGIGLLFLAAPDRNRRFLLLADRQRTRCFRDLVVRRDIRIPGLDLRFTCEFSFIGSGIGSGCSVRDSLEFMSADQSVCRDAVQRMRFSVIRYGAAFTGQGEGLPIDLQASVCNLYLNRVLVCHFPGDAKCSLRETHLVCPCIRSGCFRCLRAVHH